MSKFTLARAIFACVGTLLLLAGCNSKDDPESAFPDKLRTQVRLRDGPAKEKTRIVHYAEDKVTPLWAEVLMTNDHRRKVFYENSVMTRSEEFFKPEDGGGLYLMRTYQPDGRNLRSEEQKLPNGTVVMTGERYPDGSYSRSFYGATHQLVRHLTLALNGDTIGDEFYWPSGALQQKTTRSGDVLTVDSFDEAGFPTLSTSKDSLGYKESKTVYYAGSKQIRIKAEHAYYESTVIVYRPDSSIEQTWVRNPQTIVIGHHDTTGNVVWRQNLLLFRTRVGAAAKFSDWRIFSTEDVDRTGAVTRRILYTKENTPYMVCLPSDKATEYRFEGVLKVLRPDGTLDLVKYHNLDDTEVVKERHTAQENIREPIDPAYMQMPTEDYSIAPTQMGVLGGR
ncbi:hypothetical protein BH10CYA1_BH10CYA1_32210 [soil metagenome]